MKRDPNFVLTKTLLYLIYESFIMCTENMDLIIDFYLIQ